jgi:hypothetical protein
VLLAGGDFFHRATVTAFASTARVKSGFENLGDAAVVGGSRAFW